MGKRLPISKKTRFEVLNRDKFTCRYCGVTARDAALEIDHVKPVAGGGCNCPSNLVTACHACNRGKGVTVVGDIGPSRFDEVWRIAHDLQNAARIHFGDPELYILDFVVVAICNGRLTPEDLKAELSTFRLDEKEDFIWRLRCEVELYVQNMECPS